MSRLQNTSLVSLTHFWAVKLEGLCKDGHQVMIANYLSRYRQVYDTWSLLFIPKALARVGTYQNARTILNTSISAS